MSVLREVKEKRIQSYRVSLFVQNLARLHLYIVSYRLYIAFVRRVLGLNLKPPAHGTNTLPQAAAVLTLLE